MCAIAKYTPMNGASGRRSSWLIDYFYPNLLPGNALGVPPNWQITPADTHRINLVLQGDMRGALAIRQIDQTPIQPLTASDAELRQAIIDFLIFHS